MQWHSNLFTPVDYKGGLGEIINSKKMLLIVYFVDWHFRTGDSLRVCVHDFITGPIQTNGCNRGLKKNKLKVD